MNTIKITEDNFEEEYKESTEAIRDFLYMYFEIAGDCLPVGDFDRAELGSVDPFKYLNIDYECNYLFRPKSELRFLHQASAVHLLCQLAMIYDEDEVSGSSWMSDFNDKDIRAHKQHELQQQVPHLFQIHQVYRNNKIIQTPSIQAAFHAAFTDYDHFLSALKSVVSEVIFPAFESLFD